MRYDGLEKRLEALLAGRASGYAGLFDALLRAAKRAKKAEDHSANATAQASSVDDALLNHFMRALALAFDEAAQAGSVCVRFGAIEGALVLLKALDGSLDEAFDAKRGGDYSRVSAESVKATSGKARSVSERAEELPDDLRDALSDLFEGSGLESIPEVRRRAERATLEAGLEALYQLKLVSGLAEIERAAEALDAKRVSSVAVQSDPKLANQVNRESRAAFRLAPLAADVARVGFLKAQAGIDSALISKGRLADRDFEASRLYLAREALEEMELSETLLRFASQPAKRLRKEAVERVDRLSALLGADTYQRAAIELALRRPFAVISGGPGTGKTTTVVQILECLFAEKPDLRVALAAPTGKAASRMRQSIMQGLASDKLAGQLPHVAAVVAADANREPGQQAIRERTIHKWLLSRTSSGQRPSPESPFEADVLIIDEASMVDIHLAARLFRAVSPETRVIILGDKHQLAAVGPGAVFADISDESGALRDSVVTLRTSRRFPEGTVIAKLAKAINHETTAETVDSQALLQKDVMTASAKRGHRAVGQRADGEAHDNLFADAMPSLFEVSTDEDDAFLEVKRLLDEGNASDVSADNRYRVERHDDPFDE